MKMNKKGKCSAGLPRGCTGTAACLLAAVLALAGFCTEAAAEPSVIDPERPASLTICKLRDNDAQITTGTGYLQDVNEVPMEGIGFTIVKLADIVSVTDGGGAATGFSGVDAGFLSLLSENGIEVRREESQGETWYTPEALSDALLAMNRVGGTVPGEVQINDFVRGHGAAVGLPVTDSAGMTSVSGLPQGLYLAAETDVSGYVSGNDSGEAVYSPTSPFLVSLPMTGRVSSDDGEAGAFWQYDVTVYPKNQTVTIPKYIVQEKDGDTLQQSEDLEIGEVVRQVIAPSAPAVEPTITDLSGNTSRDRLYESYRIRDTMQAGLSLVSGADEITVLLGGKIPAPEKLSDFDGFETLVPGTDYTAVIGEDRRSFEVIFQQAGLDRLNAVSGESQAVVVFDCVLDGTASSKAGTAEAVRNQPELIWKNANTAEHSVKGNQPGVYTYRIIMHKEGLKDGSKAAFSVSRQGKELAFAREAEGIYHLWDGVLDTGKAQELIRPSASGQLEIRGLDADTYLITETATEAGHELLKASFQVTLAGREPSDGILTDVQLTSDGKTAPVRTDPAAPGTAVFTVRNYPSIVLRTGGSGLWIFEAAGLTVLALALAVRRFRHQN